MPDTMSIMLDAQSEAIETRLQDGLSGLDMSADGSIMTDTCH